MLWHWWDLLLFYGWTIFCLQVHTRTHTHILFNGVSTDQHSGCSQVLALGSVAVRLLSLLVLRQRAFFFFFFFFFRAVPAAYGSSQAMELELQPLASTTATATEDLSCVCDLHHSSRQCLITPNPLSEARDRTCILMDPSRVRFPGTTIGIPRLLLLTLHLKSADT